MRTINISKIDSLKDAIEIHNKILESTDVSLNFKYASFIRNNYLSIVGLAIEKLKNEGGEYKIIHPENTRVLKAMQDIEFLDKFTELSKGSDSYKTMIRYTNIIDDKDIKLGEFYVYFQQKLLLRVQNISKPLANKIIQKVFELFSNVFRHSESDLGLFCSGQFYPKNDKFYFTIVDGGVGIKKNVNKYFEKEFLQDKKLLSRKKYKEQDAVKCIRWAMQEGHSTTGKGGLGLALLMELIKKSDGQLEIISDNGYYAIKNGEVYTELLDDVFEGSIISIGLNTDASKFFYLQGEK
jgi:signal transduction histidine kinase